MVIHHLVYITFSVVHLSISALLAAISVLLSSFELISSILFELSSDLYGVPPRPSFPTEKCAILILGAQEGASPYSFLLHTHNQLHSSGVGRNAALSFSELGYTVFALCPNRSERSGHLPPSERSRDVASVRSVQTTYPLASQRLISPKPNSRCSKASIHLAQQEREVAIDSLGSSRAHATESLVSIPTRSSTRDRPRPLYHLWPSPRSIGHLARLQTAARHEFVLLGHHPRRDRAFWCSLWGSHRRRCVENWCPR